MRFGVFMMGLVLALSVPTLAFAYSARFYNQAPTPGSSTALVNPPISVRVYDKYGVTGTHYWMMIDGVKKPVQQTRLVGYTRFDLRFLGVVALTPGVHTVKVRVHDRRGNTTTTSWTFTETGIAPPPVDVTLPVTTIDVPLNNIDFAPVDLHATDAAPGVIRTYYKLDGGPETLFSGPFNVYAEGAMSTLHSVEYWSVDAANNSEAHKFAYFFVAPSVEDATFAQNHALPDVTCTDFGCHGTDLSTIHYGAVDDSGRKYCAVCHNQDINEGGNPPSDCTNAQCHGDTAHGEHLPITNAVGGEDCVGCHVVGADVTAITIHGPCSTCHGSTNEVVQDAIAAGIIAETARCIDCHDGHDGAALPAHTGLADHALSGGCFGNDTCHAYKDASAFHNGTPSRCAVCHTGDTADTIAETVGWANRCALPDCHPNLDAVHDEVFALYSAASASSHGAGVRTKFDGSQGITLKDTEEDTVTTDWDFPEVNVFWALDDPAAPDTAITGLTKDSVVTCFDCHSGDVEWFSGPHGASARWAIDANYPYPFKYAIVGGPAGAVSSSNPALNYRAGGGVTAATPATTTAGIPASASGIKARIAANLGTVASPIKSTNPADLMITNYQNYPDFLGAEYIADATSGQYAVICAKCHDLYNYPSLPTTGALDNGWGNAGPDSYEGVHGAHAGGTARNGNDLGRIDGRSDCASCHVAVPHGWRQPRLLVNGYTGPYLLKGGFVAQPGYEPTVTVQSVADPFPYYQGRGMPLAAGVGAMAPAPATSPGNGPNDAKDNHAANAFGKPVWEEAACISCSGSTTGVGWAGLEHRGLTTEPAKLKDK